LKKKEEKNLLEKRRKKNIIFRLATLEGKKQKSMLHVPQIRTKFGM